MNELQMNINKMTVNGSRLELPKLEVFKNYGTVKKVLIAAGGKYKRSGFEFTTDPQDIKDRLVGGETINDKKKFQFFATPDSLAKLLVDKADIKPTDRVLEPSAGQGAIVDNFPLNRGYVLVELMPDNVKVLESKKYHVIENDFLALSNNDIGMFDKIVANPPFTNNQDIEHILHMYSMLEDGGRLVSISSNSWRQGSQAKQKLFKEWLTSVDAEIIDVDAGSFKESGTSVATNIIIINKQNQTEK